MQRAFHTAVTLLLTLSACAHATLDKGASVVPTDVRPADTCAEVGSLRASSHGSLIYADTLEESAVSDLRNQAAELGATTVLIQSRYPSAHAYRVRGLAFKCAPAAAAP